MPPDAVLAVRSWIGRFSLVALVLGALLAFGALTRLALLGYAWQTLDAGAPAIASAIAVGEVFDILAALWLVAPFAALLALMPERWFARRGGRRCVRAWLFALVTLGVFVVAAELIFFDEFNGRFNFVAVDYLIFPTEVVTNLWESYPLPALVLGVVLAGVGIMWLARARVSRGLHAHTSPGTRAAGASVYAAALCALTLGVSPELAHVSDDRALNEIALNGYYTFWLAFLGQDAPYEGLYATRAATVETARLGALLAEPSASPLLSPQSAPTLRHIVSPLPEHRRNVVVVLEESMGSAFLASMHPHGDTVLTPRFDSLISEGTLLSHAYATGNRTIRALEATTSSLPPLPGISIVRRPASRDLATLPNLLKALGYHTSFIYGGRALFDGMGSYMSNNGISLVVEQADYASDAFATAWGVADEHIFDKALSTYDSVHKVGLPFYSLVLSVSNHKPYTYPAGRIAADPDRHWRVNAVQYADWALGRFMRAARDRPWFANTLFVLMGDHGARVYGAPEIPLASYEIPILFYAPAFIPAGQRIETIASSIDLPSTIVARLGIPYDSRWFGQDVFSVDPTRGRALMTHNANLALLRGDRLAILGLRGSTSVRDVDVATRRLSRPATLDSVDDTLVEDAIAYFHTADRLYRTGGYRMLPMKRAAPASPRPASPAGP